MKLSLQSHLHVKMPEIIPLAGAHFQFIMSLLIYFIQTHSASCFKLEALPCFKM